MTQPSFEQPKSPSFSIFNANGRLGRLSYAAWLFLVLFVSSLSIVLGVFFLYGSLSSSTIILTPSSHFNSTATIGSCVVLVLITYINFILTIKRLHDLDKVGWISLLIFVPIVGAFLPIYLLCTKGTNGCNTYGQPNQIKIWHYVFGWPMLLTTAITTIAIVISVTKFLFIPHHTTQISKETIFIEQKIASEPASIVKTS